MSHRQPRNHGSTKQGFAIVSFNSSGLPQANGTYRRDGTHDGAPKYSHTGGQLVIVRTRGNWYRWMIADKERLDEAKARNREAYSSCCCGGGEVVLGHELGLRVA